MTGAAFVPPRARLNSNSPTSSELIVSVTLSN